MRTSGCYITMALLLAACQSRPATAPTATVSDAPTNVPTATRSVSTTPTPTIPVIATAQPVIHRSSDDPNAPNLIVVRDQPIVNGGVIVDLVRAAQPGWLAFYLTKNGKPGHPLGYVAVPRGESQQLSVRLDPNSGIAITSSVLAGKQIFAVLQAGSKAPGVPVEVAGRSVLEPFTVLEGGNP